MQISRFWFPRSFLLLNQEEGLLGLAAGEQPSIIARQKNELILLNLRQLQQQLAADPSHILQRTVFEFVLHLIQAFSKNGLGESQWARQFPSSILESLGETLCLNLNKQLSIFLRAAEEQDFLSTIQTQKRQDSLLVVVFFVLYYLHNTIFLNEVSVLSDEKEMKVPLNRKKKKAKPLDTARAQNYRLLLNI